METQTHEPRDPRARGGARGGPLGSMRASDADRDAMAEILRDHYAAGRLDAQEFEERIERCYTAKRLNELDELLTDLPRDSAPSAAPPEPPHRGYWPWWGPAVVVPIIIVLIAVAAFTHGHFFWLAWPLFFLFFGPFGWRCGWRGTRRTQS